VHLKYKIPYIILQKDAQNKQKIDELVKAGIADFVNFYRATGVPEKDIRDLKKRLTVSPAVKDTKKDSIKTTETSQTIVDPEKLQLADLNISISMDDLNKHKDIFFIKTWMNLLFKLLLDTEKIIKSEPKINVSKANCEIVSI